MNNCKLLEKEKSTIPSINSAMVLLWFSEQELSASALIADNDTILPKGEVFEMQLSLACEIHIPEDNAGAIFHLSLGSVIPL